MCVEVGNPIERFTVGFQIFLDSCKRFLPDLRRVAGNCIPAAFKFRHGAPCGLRHFFLAAESPVPRHPGQVEVQRRGGFARGTVRPEYISVDSELPFLDQNAERPTQMIRMGQGLKLPGARCVPLAKRFIGDTLTQNPG